MPLRVVIAVAYAAVVALPIWALATDRLSERSWGASVAVALVASPLGGAAIGRWWALLLPLTALVVDAPQQLSSFDEWRRASDDPDPLPSLPPFSFSAALAALAVPLVASGVVLAKATARYRGTSVSI